MNFDESKSSLAHITEDGTCAQTVKEHLEGTAQLSAEFAKVFGCEEWGYCCGMLHDIGKYSDAFQKHIRGAECRVDHATAGAQLCRDLKGLYVLLAYCIAGHHAGLPDTGAISDDGRCKSMMGRLKKKIEPYDKFRNEIEIPSLKTLPFNSGYRGGEKDSAFIFSMLIRMLFSSLVDADYLDTEKFMQQGNIVVRNKGQSMDSLLKKAMRYVKGWLQSSETDTVNGRRTEILGDENVLENHSNVEYQDSEELKPLQLATENWDKPVVVTTNVQFFESLFSNKSSKCRKLHNIANSVIIFDEAQMLPLDYLKPCVAVIEELVRHYECSAVLCTATQPALRLFFTEKMNAIELCPNVDKQFNFFKRTSIHNLNVISEQKLVDLLSKENQALCILNTKEQVNKIYQKVRGEGVYYLSTYMYPAHRRRVISEIKERLMENKKCIVISTSLVEAGVDFDFKSVYRELAGVDSIIQAAGRCNREGKRAAEESLVYIFQMEGTKSLPGQNKQIEAAKYVLETEDDITSQKAIRKYFETLYYFQGEGLDKKRILEQFHHNIYPFATVAKEFKLIEQNTKSIFISKEEEAEAILREIQQKGATKELMRKAGKYVVNVYENLYRRLEDAGMLLPVSEENNEDFFMLRDVELYTWECGLQVREIDAGGNALFW